MIIHVELDSSSIDRAIAAVEEYEQELRDKCNQLCERLANYGLLLAEASFGGAAYDGPNDVSVTLEPSTNGYRIVAGGMSALFIEFGAGVKLGYGHPLAGEFGMGPGTYNPTSKNWSNPWGWWLPKEKGGGHTYGNPPSMSMYNASMDMMSEVESIAQEVFSI